MSSEQKNTVDIVPAILPKSRDELVASAEKVHTFARIVQLDVVDGVFSGGLSWPYVTPGNAEDFSDFRLPYSDVIFYEADLMVKEPLQIGLSLIHSGARRIIAHAEVFEDDNAARDTLDAWRSAGAEVGISILIDTPVSAIEGIVRDVSMVQVMGIASVGAQGHPFDPRAIARVQELRAHFPEVTIAVDGGIGLTHGHELARAGAQRLVIGSAIIKNDDPQAAYVQAVNSVEHI